MKTKRETNKAQLMRLWPFRWLITEEFGAFTDVFLLQFFPAELSSNPPRCSSAGFCWLGVSRQDFRSQQSRQTRGCRFSSEGPHWQATWSTNTEAASLPVRWRGTDGLGGSLRRIRTLQIRSYFCFHRSLFSKSREEPLYADIPSHPHSNNTDNTFLIKTIFIRLI